MVSNRVRRKLMRPSVKNHVFPQPNILIQAAINEFECLHWGKYLNVSNWPGAAILALI